jgi:exodeoxyribonuclease VII small subunit
VQVSTALSVGGFTVADSKARRANLEKAMVELEEIVAQLETGDLPLDKSLQQFERGVKLSRQCQQALEQAEQKVEILMGDELKEFSAEDQNEQS